MPDTLIPEKDKKYGKDEFVFMSFTCPRKRIFEARKILDDLELENVVAVTEVTNIFAFRNENVKTVEGIEFRGTVKMSDFKKALKALEKNKIAGYSRETQIMCSKVVAKKE